MEELGTPIDGVVLLPLSQAAALDSQQHVLNLSESIYFIAHTAWGGADQNEARAHTHRYPRRSGRGVLLGTEWRQGRARKLDLGEARDGSFEVSNGTALDPPGQGADQNNQVRLAFPHSRSQYSFPRFFQPVRHIHGVFCSNDLRQAGRRVGDLVCSAR